jgi:hypothetical protein
MKRFRFGTGRLAASAFALLIPALSLAAPAHGQQPRWDASAELSLARLGSVDETAAGAGLRLSYRLADLLALDAGAVFAPGDLGDPAFSASQTELSIGLRVGPRPDPFGYYAAVRGGTLRYAEAPEPLPCIAIFPPPLTCVLAAGHTGASVQFAAGAERRVGSAGLLRLEVGDRMVRLPGPAFDPDGEIRDEDFWAHELRVAVSVGLRF